MSIFNIFYLAGLTTLLGFAIAIIVYNFNPSVPGNEGLERLIDRLLGYGIGTLVLTFVAQLLIQG